MIHSLTVTNHLNEAINIVLGDSDSSGFLITRIEGLGPSKATINSTEMATGDGSVFNSARLEPRNIVISMTFDNRYNYDIESIRQKSYKYFPIKKQITLKFYLDNRVCEIKGIVESNEPDIFSPMESSQISIICPDPYFYSADDEDNITKFGSSTDGFEFAYDTMLGYGVIYNDALTFDRLGEPTLEFGSMTTTDRNYVYYSGDSEIGINIAITALTSVGDITISQGGKSKLMTVRADKISKITGMPIIEKDIIEISTVRNNKFIRLLRSGKYYNILNSLDKGAYWFKLERGDNIFSYTTSEGLIQMEIRNQTIYEGV